MPTRKQRRRQQKQRRHEYEYVYVDDEGREVEVEEAEPARAGATSGAKPKARERKQPAPRGGRAIEPPSWRRVGKRALIFAPLMFITVHFLAEKGMTVQQKALQTLFLLAIFLPFSYVMDSLTYRLYKRRVERETQNR